MRNVSVLFALSLAVSGADAQETQRTRDVIYGRKHGLVMTMDVFRPAKQNGAAVIWVVSGGWFSSHAAINVKHPEPFAKRGYTVFAVVHGSQPKFSIPEILEDMHRAVRFVRHNAKDYGTDPERIGITGGSAGGHLSLMQGTAGVMGNPKAADPIDRDSSRVQAVACFFPPTDFLNYGKPGEDALGRGILVNYKAPFVFQEFDPKAKAFKPITDEERFVAVGKKISPINHVSFDDPPTLIIHGDADKLVPIQQAEIMIAKLKESGVPAELVVRPGAAHGWANIHNDLEIFADWFDKHLTRK
jgi:acetyl esterase/lipase